MSNYYITQGCENMWKELAFNHKVIIKVDGVEVFTANSPDSAFKYIHDHQGQSVAWACAYQGWSVESSLKESFKLKMVSILALPDKLDQIICVPHHLNTMEQIEDESNWNPLGIERGFVVNHSPGGAYCRFWNYDYRTHDVTRELRTKSNSELCQFRNLYYKMTYAPGIVQEAYDACYS